MSGCSTKGDAVRLDIRLQAPDGGGKVIPPAEIHYVNQVEDHKAVRLVQVHAHSLAELLRIVPVVLHIHAAEERIVRTEEMT